MKNNPIQSFWIGDALSPMEVLCIRSFLSHGHEFHLYVYEPIDNIPERTVVLDANDILPKEKIFRDSFGTHVNLSNQFRYAMLYKIGGWWVDLDSVCLKPFDFEEDFVFASETSDPYFRIHTTTGFIKSPPGAKVMKDCLQFTENRGIENLHWGELGITLFSRMILRNGLGKYIQLPDCFCPVSSYQWEKMIKDVDIPLPESAYSVHWWHELWRRKKINKWGIYPEMSLYEQLKRKYGVM